MNYLNQVVKGAELHIVWQKEEYREADFGGGFLLFVSAAEHNTDSSAVLHLNFIKISFCWALIEVHDHKLLSCLPVSQKSPF